MTIPKQTSFIVATVIATLIAAASPAHAAFPNKCAAGKEKCTGKDAAGKLGCHTKAEYKGTLVESACLAKSSTKLTTCFAKLDAKGGCFTTADGATMDASVDAYVNDIVTTVDPGYPTVVQNRCSAYKKRCVAKKIAGLLGCYSKGAAKGQIVSATCLAAYTAKFNTCISKIELKYDAACLTLGDGSTLESKSDDFAFGVAAVLEPVCGNNTAETPFEGCDGTDDAACPGLCRPPGDLNECQCPVCGDHQVNQASEQCDRQDSAACPGLCALDCTCSVCGNNLTEPLVETCDGTDDAACPGLCAAPAAPNPCRCPECGDGIVNQASEACDGGDDTACPGLCSATCQCTVCGNNVTDAPLENCDGTDDGNCPGLCLAPSDPNECQCPICGDNSVNQAVETCDGTDDTTCPGLCQSDCQCP